jgi:hypothetical protein
MRKFHFFPDLIAHNESLTVGDAVLKLKKYSIEPERIRFNVVKKHPSMGEIVTQKPSPGDPFSVEREIDLDVNSWSAFNEMRFFFFQADEVLQAETELDESQLEDWLILKTS